jgi:hypothetical protein
MRQTPWRSRGWENARGHDLGDILGQWGTFDVCQDNVARPVTNELEVYNVASDNPVIQRRAYQPEDRGSRDSVQPFGHIRS